LTILQAWLNIFNHINKHIIIHDYYGFNVKLIKWEIYVQDGK